MKAMLYFPIWTALIVVLLSTERVDFVEAQVCPQCATACGPISGTDAYVYSLSFRQCNPANGYHGAMDVCNGRPSGKGAARQPSGAARLCRWQRCTPAHECPRSSVTRDASRLSYKAKNVVTNDSPPMILFVRNLSTLRANRPKTSP